VTFSAFTAAQEAALAGVVAVALLLVEVMDPPVASATSIGMLDETVNIPMAMNTRRRTPCR